MAKVRIMTFNVENMFTRFAFKRASDLEDYLGLLEGEDEALRLTLAKGAWLALDDEARTFCALAIREGRPDVVLLQEVESLHALRRFHDKYLLGVGGEPLPHLAVLEGNDSRGIQVGLMSRFPFDGLASHRDLSYGELARHGFRWGDWGLPDLSGERPFQPDLPVFRRDCLEARLEIEGRPLLVFACHFKSMEPTRAASRAARLAEAFAVRHLVESRAAARGLTDWIVGGDLNDYDETDGRAEPEHALAPLLAPGFAIDVGQRIADPLERWTHFYPAERSYHRLDYLLLSPALAARNAETRPEMLRSGLPYRAERYQGPRYPRIGWDRPKASDHAPMIIELEI